MKYTFNLNNINTSTTVDRVRFNSEGKEDSKREANLSFQVEGISITVECDVQEMGVATKSILDMRAAFIQGSKEVFPIVKEGVIEIGKIFSSEALRHNQIDHSYSMERLELERRIEGEKHENWRERNNAKA